LSARHAVLHLLSPGRKQAGGERSDRGEEEERCAAAGKRRDTHHVLLLLLSSGRRQAGGEEARRRREGGEAHSGAEMSKEGIGGDERVGIGDERAVVARISHRGGSFYTDAVKKRTAEIRRWDDPTAHKR
jgi:hypothetical protein